MSDRGQYSSASKVVLIGLVIAGALLMPVVAIVGGAALAAAVGGRGGKR